ncbi:MAG: hypothetical protein WCG13_18120 [Burkholderiales bacterium]
MPQNARSRSPAVHPSARSLPARLLLALVLPAAGLNLAAAQTASPAPAGAAGGSKAEAATAPKTASEPARKTAPVTARKTDAAAAVSPPPAAPAAAAATATAPAPVAPARVPDQVWSTQPSPVPAYISGGGAAVIVAPVVVPPVGVRPGPAPRPHPGVPGSAGAGTDRPAGVIRPERAP